jgi:type I restriction enzyme S subunit
VIDLQKVDVARANISLADISNLAFRVPPLREQARIVEEQNRRLSIAEALEQALTFNLARAERLRQSILKRAFEGRLVPTEAELARRDGRDYEPADVLLRRIRGVEASSQGRRRKDAEEELEQSSLF